MTKEDRAREPDADADDDYTVPGDPETFNLRPPGDPVELRPIAVELSQPAGDATDSDKSATS